MHRRSAEAFKRRQLRWMKSGRDALSVKTATEVKTVTDAKPVRRIIQQDSIIQCHLAERIMIDKPTAPKAAPLCEDMSFEDWMYSLGDLSKGRHWNLIEWAQWRKQNHLI